MKTKKISKNQNIRCNTITDVFNQENADKGNNYIDEDIIPSPYAVMVVVMFYKNGDYFKLVHLIADRNEVELMLKIGRNICMEHPGQVWKTHQHLKSLIYQKGVPADYFKMVVLNFLSYFNEPSRICSAIPDQSLGFKIHIDVDDYHQCIVYGKTFQELDVEFNKMISQ